MTQLKEMAIIKKDQFCSLGLCLIHSQPHQLLEDQRLLNWKK